MYVCVPEFIPYKSSWKKSTTLDFSVSQTYPLNSPLEFYQSLLYTERNPISRAD